MKEQTVFAVANFFLNQEDHGLDNLKLNKIVYISLGFCFGVANFELFEDEVQAWQFGPVIPRLYHVFKMYQVYTIPSDAGIPNHEIDKKEEKDIIEILETVCNIYKNKTSSGFIEMTHQRGTPWAAHYTGERDVVIERATIKNYYEKFLDNVSKYG